MKKTLINNSLKAFVLISLVIAGGCKKKIDGPGTLPVLPENPDFTEAYLALKGRCASEASVYYQDFDQDNTVTQLTPDQWRIGDTDWWFPAWNDHEGPVLQGNSLVFTSQKNGAVSAKNEAQSMTDYTLTTDGELVMGIKSSRWEKGFEHNQDYWADSSVGFEFYYPDGHQGIVFVFGSFGVFKDPTGFCPDGTCLYGTIAGWPAIAAEGKFVGVRITWHTETDNTKTFKIYINNEKNARGEVRNVQYDFKPFKIRMNANVTDTDQLPEVDADTFSVDYLCIKNSISNF